tara:strand:- start:1013 stop:1246 length:234 start_codon:yes stop_codon:yes gene_type:complete
MKQSSDDPRLLKIAKGVVKKLARCETGDTTMSPTQVVIEGLVKAYERGQIDTWLKKKDDNETQARNKERRRKRDEHR